MNCENKVLIWSKLWKLTNSNNITNTEANGIVGWKIVRPTRFWSVCFCPGGSERLPTPDIQYHSKVRPWSIWIMIWTIRRTLQLCWKVRIKWSWWVLSERILPTLVIVVAFLDLSKVFIVAFFVIVNIFYRKMKTLNSFMTKVCRDNERLNIYFQVKS